MGNYQVKWIENVLQDKELSTTEIVEELRRTKKRPPSIEVVSNLLAGKPQFEKTRVEEKWTTSGQRGFITYWKRRNINGN
jgi:hypothetical protein